MKEKLFMTPEYTTYKERKRVRKKLGLTQKNYPISLWYKADYTGYEGLAKYVISRIL